MPRNKDIKKVLVIGSGPIVIGQAAEFDYAGTQACRSLKEEGLEVVLLNSNPATIMTDKDIADRPCSKEDFPHFPSSSISKETKRGGAKSASSLLSNSTIDRLFYCYTI